MPGSKNEDTQREQLLATESVTIGFDFRHGSDQVGLRVGATFGDDFVKQGDEPVETGLRLVDVVIDRRAATGTERQHALHALAIEFAPIVGNAEHLADNRRRQRQGERMDQLGFIDSTDVIEQPFNDRFDTRLEVLQHARREHQAHKPAHARVIRWIDIEQPAADMVNHRCGAGTVLRQQRIGVHRAATGRQAFLFVAQGRAYIIVAGHQPHVHRFAPMHRILFAQACKKRIRVIQPLVTEVFVIRIVGDSAHKLESLEVQNYTGYQ